MPKPKNPIRQPFIKKEITEMTKRIKKVRTMLKLTGSELSVALGYDRSYVSQVEIPSTIPPTSMFIGLLYKIYNVNPNYILLGYEPIFFSNEPIKQNILADDDEKELPITDDEVLSKAFQQIVKRMNTIQNQNKTETSTNENETQEQEKHLKQEN